MLRLAASRRGGAKPSAAPGSIKGGGRPETRSLYRPEPEVLPLPAETSREAPKCCAWQHQEGGPETRSGTVQSLKCCPCQQKRAARLPSAAPGSIKGGGPETRSGTVQSLKCCPCQQKRAARLPSAAPGSKGGGPRNALGYRPEPEVLPLPAETSREANAQGGGPRNALGHRPEPEVLPLPASAALQGPETSREAPKCCAWASRGGAPKRARAPSRA